MIVASFYAPRFEKWDGCDYDQLLLLLDKSCKKLGLEHVVISDEIRPEPLKTIKFDLPENLMQAIISGQGKFLDRTPGEILLVGADCLLTKRFYVKGMSNIDLVITTDDEFSDCRMNTGMIWCQDGPTCAPIWHEALRARPDKWGDDQTCLYSAIKNSNLIIAEVECNKYNKAPESISDNANLATVIHFRGGNRKKFMHKWAERHLDIN